MYLQAKGVPTQFLQQAWRHCGMSWEITLVGKYMQQQKEPAC
jgi:hypothetical protein